jgi:Domain of unknown function (DUF1707)
VGRMSDSFAEPANVGPSAGGSLRASDADREKVATVLSAAYAEGRITRDEHDERLDQVMRARTFDDLVPITSDLVPAALPSPGQASALGTSYALETANPSSETEYLVAIFGAATRTGRWRVRKSSTALAVFGGVDLDLRNAIFEAPVVEITGLWCFGGLDIKVPEGIEVRDQTIGIFGGTDVRDLGDPQPGAPVVVIKGLALFGGVSVRGPKSAKKRRHP